MRGVAGNLSCVGFFMAVWSWVESGNSSGVIGAAMLSTADDDDALTFRAVLEMDGHAAGLIVARTDGHMHSAENLFAVMHGDVVLSILCGLSVRNMGTETTQVYVLLEKGVSCNALMSALAHALSCKVESLKYLAESISIPEDAILGLLDRLAGEDDMSGLLWVVVKLGDDLPDRYRGLLGLRLFRGDILRTFRSAEIEDRMQDRHDLAPGPHCA